MTPKQKSRLRSVHSRSNMLKEIEMAMHIRECMRLDLDCYYRLDKKYQEPHRLAMLGCKGYSFRKKLR